MGHPTNSNDSTDSVMSSENSTTTMQNSPKQSYTGSQLTGYAISIANIENIFTISDGSFTLSFSAYKGQSNAQPYQQGVLYSGVLEVTGLDFTKNADLIEYSYTAPTPPPKGGKNGPIDGTPAPTPTPPEPTVTINTASAAGQIQSIVNAGLQEAVISGGYNPDLFKISVNMFLQPQYTAEDIQTPRIIINNNSYGLNSMIGYAGTSSTGTDLSSLLCLTESTGARATAGTKKT